MILIAATGLSAISCRHGRVYKSPAFDTDSLVRDWYPTDTFSIADIPWQEFFTDPVLLGLIDEGVRNNTDIQVAYARIEAAEAELRMARQALFPNASVAAEVNETLTSDGTSGRKVLGYSSPQYSLGITSTWEADIWGKLSATKRSQYASFLNSLEYRNLIYSSLVANIATTYYSLLALDRQLEITENMAQVLDQTVRTMEALMEAGIQNGASVQQSRAVYYATVVTIPDIESSIRQTENSLSVLIGRGPGPIERTGLDSQDVVPLIHTGVPAQMLARRPDVRQAELTFRSAFELTSAARAAFYPSVTLGSGSFLGWTSTSFTDFFRPEKLMANIIGQLTMPLFAQGQLRGNLRVAEATQEEAFLNFRQTVLTAGQEVSDIIYSFSSSVTKNPIRTLQIDALETAVYFTQELLTAGEADYTEVLTAQQSLLSAQLNRVSDRLEQLQYGVQLYKALGGGYPFPDRQE